ncbi:MAG: hypothetical protein C4523_01405 [Myxococcales bacterium]|nr:MAG: hypothetical protein C4523_01405 [Myxococcales bacterium]
MVATIRPKAIESAKVAIVAIVIFCVAVAIGRNVPVGRFVAIRRFIAIRENLVAIGHSIPIGKDFITVGDCVPVRKAIAIGRSITVRKNLIAVQLVIIAVRNDAVAIGREIAVRNDVVAVRFSVFPFIFGFAVAVYISLWYANAFNAEEPRIAAFVIAAGTPRSSGGHTAFIPIEGRKRVELGPFAPPKSDVHQHHCAQGDDPGVHDQPLRGGKRLKTKSVGEILKAVLAEPKRKNKPQPTPPSPSIRTVRRI